MKKSQKTTNYRAKENDKKSGAFINKYNQRS